MPVTSEAHVTSCLRQEEKTFWDLYNRLCSLLSLVFGSHLQRREVYARVYTCASSQSGAVFPQPLWVSVTGAEAPSDPTAH